MRSLIQKISVFNDEPPVEFSRGGFIGAPLSYANHCGMCNVKCTLRHPTVITPTVFRKMSETILSYLGPNDIIIDQPVVLIGNYASQYIDTISVMAEDQYPLPTQLSPRLGIWFIPMPKGFNTAGKRWLRVQGKDQSGKVVADTWAEFTVGHTGLNVGLSTQLIVLQDTTFKHQAIASDRLTSEQKYDLEIGEILAVDSYELQNDHFYIELTNPLGDLGRSGYLYRSHILLIQGAQILWFNRDDIPPNPPGTKLIWVTHDTVLKRSPDDRSQLPENAIYPLSQGSSYLALGYACVADHFRVTLTESLPGYGHVGYLYRYHLQMFQGDREITFDHNAITLTIINTTLFKKRPIDSAYLSPEEQVTLPAGMIYGVQSYTTEDGHLKVALTENFPGFGNTGYFFPNFVQLNRATASYSPTPSLTYEGPPEVLINTPVVLKGQFDGQQAIAVSLVAEDRYPLEVVINRQAGTWTVNLEAGFSEPGYRWLRLKTTDDQGQLVASQIINITVSENAMTVGESLQLDVIEDTLFKVSPIDSNLLGSEQQVTVPAGQTFKVSKYGLVDGHLKLLLENGIPPIGSFGYFFRGHVRLRKGSTTLAFDMEEVPDTNISAQMLVTTTTRIKAQPIDSANLAPDQFAELLLGQNFAIRGYASFQGHFRVTLDQSIPGFGNVGYVYWQHVSLLRDGKAIAYNPDAITMTMRETTVLKKRPVDSGQLAESEKVTLPLGRVYGVSSYSTDQSHVRVALTEELPNFGNTGYIFPKFVKFQRGGKVFDPTPPQVLINVPYFSQRDNPRFYWSTCNVTCIAMVMHYYGVRSKWGGQLEDELLQWCFDYAGQGSQTNHSVLSALIRAYGFQGSFSTTRRWSEVRNELINSRPVVLAGDFTPSGHIVTVIGYNRYGYIVHDPWGDAYTGYSNTEGRRLPYSYSYLNRVCGPDGNVWAHFIRP